MTLETYHINSLQDYHDLIRGETDHRSLLRGHKKKEGYDLIPSVGRYVEKFEDLGYNKDDLFQKEKKMFDLFMM